MSSLNLQSTIRLASGYEMPILGFGVYQNYSARQSVLEAFKAGYRHVDSAQAYKNEAAVGEALRDSGLNRSDVFLTTKYILSKKTYGYEKTLRGVDKSLAAFGIDYIDLFLVHNPHGSTELRLDTYRALQDAKAAGKIRSIGVSNYGISHLQEIVDANFDKPVINQLELHIFCQQRPIVTYCRENAIIIQAHTPLIRGNKEHEIISRISRKHNKDNAQILLRWSLQHGFVPLPKSATPARIVSNTLLYDFELDSGDMEQLDSLDQGKDGAVSWNPVDVD